MTTYAKLNRDKLSVESYVQFEILPPHKEGFILPFITTPVPVVDPRYQYIVELPPSITSTQVIQQWEVRLKPAEVIEWERTNEDVIRRISEFKTSNLWQKILDGDDLNNTQVENVVKLLIRIVMHDKTPPPRSLP